jgi:hypothetical protein
MVLLGNVATDDPEGPEVYESLLKCREERIVFREGERKDLWKVHGPRVSVSRHSEPFSPKLSLFSTLARSENLSNKTNY